MQDGQSSDEERGTAPEQREVGERGTGSAASLQTWLKRHDYIQKAKHGLRGLEKPRKRKRSKKSKTAPAPPNGKDGEDGEDDSNAPIRWSEESYDDAVEAIEDHLLESWLLIRGWGYTEKRLVLRVTDGGLFVIRDEFKKTIHSYVTVPEEAEGISEEHYSVWCKTKPRMKIALFRLYSVKEISDVENLEEGVKAFVTLLAGTWRELLLKRPERVVQSLTRLQGKMRRQFLEKKDLATIWAAARRGGPDDIQEVISWVCFIYYRLCEEIQNPDRVRRIQPIIFSELFPPKGEGESDFTLEARGALNTPYGAAAKHLGQQRKTKRDLQSFPKR